MGAVSNPGVRKIGGVAVVKRFLKAWLVPRVIALQALVVGTATADVDVVSWGSQRTDHGDPRERYVQVAAGGCHTIALRTLTDCNRNAQRDSCRIQEVRERVDKGRLCRGAKNAASENSEPRTCREPCPACPFHWDDLDGASG